MAVITFSLRVKVRTSHDGIAGSGFLILVALRFKKPMIELHNGQTQGREASPAVVVMPVPIQASVTNPETTGAVA